MKNAKLYEFNLEEANLRGANLTNIEEWIYIDAIKETNIYDVKNAPDGFREWALENGATSGSGLATGARGESVRGHCPPRRICEYGTYR